MSKRVLNVANESVTTALVRGSVNIVISYTVRFLTMMAATRPMLRW